MEHYEAALGSHRTLWGGFVADRRRAQLVYLKCLALMAEGCTEKLDSKLTLTLTIILTQVCNVPPSAIHDSALPSSARRYSPPAA